MWSRQSNSVQFFFTCFAVIWGFWGSIMNLNLSQAMAPMHKDDIMTGKFCPALTSRQRISVLSPSGQWPSRVDQSVSGEVKLQRKKSEMARVMMNAFLGSFLSLFEDKVTPNIMVFTSDPIITRGKYRPRSRWYA